MKSKIVQEYRRVMTRPLGLIDVECWDIGERVMMPKKFKKLLAFDPLFVYTPQKAVAVYYNFTDPKQKFDKLISFLEKNISWLEKEKNKLVVDCQEIRQMIKNSSDDYRKIFDLVCKIWPVVAVANALGSTKVYKISDGLMSICLEIREASDDVSHPGLNYISNLISHLLKSKEEVVLILFSEFVKKKLPAADELKSRSKGWLYHQGKVVCDIKKYIEIKDIKLVDLVEPVASFLKGQVACLGYAKGRVRIVFELADLKKVNKGDILVTPMTTPEMVVSIKKAAAIVTDEGGITCHASIVSRELKIPCVIGTTSATSILKDGDLVEVDAKNGVIKIL